jgi:hypothetical protein
MQSYPHGRFCGESFGGWAGDYDEVLFMIRWVLERKRNGRTDGRGTGTHSPSIRQHLLGNCSAILPFSSASSVIFPLVPNPKIPKEKVQIDEPIACVAIALKPSFLVKERDRSVQNV